MTAEFSRALRLRQLGYLVRHPRHMLRLQVMRRSQNRTGYSLQQFERTRSIFIHIPKASGVSITRSLYGNLGCGHLPMREYELAFSPRFVRESFIFTFVRNPWDRLHSAYRFLVKGGMNRADAQWRDAHRDCLASFEQFVEAGLRVPEIAGSLHIIPQSRFLHSPVYGYQCVDFVGFFENLDDDFGAVCRAMSVQDTALPHQNRTAGDAVDYKTVYTNRMRDIVAEFYREDIDLLGYDFGGDHIVQQIARRDRECAI